MNVFRIAADLFHLLALIILIVKLVYTKSSKGISGRSQLLFTFVYSTRYADLFLGFVFISYYNTIMKILFLSTTYITLILIFYVHRRTYEVLNDIYFTEPLLMTAFICSYTLGPPFDISELLWRFSIVLEAVAIVPQMVMIYRSRQIQKMVMYYLIALGLYRTLYIANWVWRYHEENHLDFISVCAGVFYSMVYVAFLCIFIVSGVKIVEEKNEGHFVRNIFFIHQLDTASETLIHDEIDVEKDVNGIEKV
ncbi:hypothetical protein NQ317_008530 [Molorchus minor]|uniref:ER lumen protein-retaining receptor n=1 Tax=Molorchus minor TaxID=1323400 RepID=A0ABQ9J0B3_9CUCU|nr:hypothetical protein NQ317_008530 [Molorchus minor]